MYYDYGLVEIGTYARRDDPPQNSELLGSCYANVAVR
jgi:hypothetical protein